MRGFGWSFGFETARAATPAPPFPSHLRGVFHFLSGETEWEAMTGAPADLIGRFAVNTDEDQVPAASLAELNDVVAALPPNRNVHWSIPLAWPTVTMAQVAAGAADGFYEGFAAAIIAATPGQYWRPIRIGWEMNHGNYAWAASGNAAGYIAAFRHVSDLIRSLVPHAIVEWCVSLGDDDPASYWPGDAYVDVVGGDAYLVSAEEMSGGELSMSAWAEKKAGSIGFDWLATFGDAHGKPIAISEWGYDSDDCLDYIRLQAEWEDARNLAWSMYFDEDAMWSNKISDSSYPLATAEFVRRRGAPRIDTLAAWRIAPDMAWDIPLQSMQSGTWKLKAGVGGSIDGAVLTVPPRASGAATFTVELTAPNGWKDEKDIAVTSSAFTPVHASAIAFIARAGTLDEGYKEAIDAFFTALAGHGLLAKADLIYVPAARTQAASLLNWKGDYGNGVVEGTGLAWMPNRGWRGAPGGKINTNLAGNRSGNQYAEASAGIAVWSLKHLSSDVPIVAQAAENTKLIPRNGAGNMLAQMLDWSDLAAANADGSGFFVGTRTGASARAIRRNTTQIAADTGGGASRADANFWLFDQWGGGAPWECCFVYIGSGLTAAQADNLRGDALALLTAVVPGGV
jgi:hypothetical protein